MSLIQWSYRVIKNSLKEAVLPTLGNQLSSARGATFSSTHAKIIQVRTSTCCLKLRIITCLFVQDRLYDYGIEAPVKCIGSRLYLRVSAQVYNEVSDYEHVANILPSVLNDADKA